ncbi:MAG: D-arabinono-1,4-lactone oxidase [Polyangiales bacterium]
MRRDFASLHDAVVARFEAFPLSDPRASPIVTAVEMRTLASSSALLSPGYQPADRRAEVFIAAPEIVTTANHPAWEDFAQEMNTRMTTDPAFGREVRGHQGKPCHAWPHPDHPETGMRGYLRQQYRDAGTWEPFLAVRTRVDPDGFFLNPYLRAWFDMDEPA